MVLRYMLIKLAMVKLNEIHAFMDSKEVEKYRLEKEFVLTKEAVAKYRKIIEMQYKHMSLEVAA